MHQHEWIDKKEYPFKSHFLPLTMGRMHYVDEGNGSPIVMVHGNPTWSFLYRHLIKGLSKTHRCIAMDHIGFGLSDKPTEWSYLPEEHARNLEALLHHLDLKEITLIVHDWGGPIGLAYAIHHPDNVKNIILMNTWMWSAKGDPHYERFSKMIGGPIGRFLIKRFNFFVRVIMKQAMGDKSKLPPAIHQHYLKVARTPEERKGSWVFPKQIIGSSDWLSHLWSQRDKLKEKPTLILWGKKDIAFRKKELEQWSALFLNKEVVVLEGVGHFVQEEKGEELCPIIERFLKQEQEG